MLYTGDNHLIDLPLTWQGAAFVPGTDWGLIFTAKKALSDSDANALIQKTLVAGITVTDSTATIELVPDDTKTLRHLSLYCDIQAQHLSTAEIRTVYNGSLTFQRAVTREFTPSIPVLTTNPPIAIGPPGLSAYQSYLATTTDDPPLSEAEWVASLHGEDSTVPLPAFEFATTIGDVTPDLGNGPIQSLTPTGDITLLAPTGTPSDMVSRVELYITGAGFDLLGLTGIEPPTSSTITFPRTLSADNGYILQLRYAFGGWQLVTFVGPYPLPA